MLRQAAPEQKSSMGSQGFEKKTHLRPQTDVVGSVFFEEPPNIYIYIYVYVYVYIFILGKRQIWICLVLKNPPKGWGFPVVSLSNRAKKGVPSKRHIHMGASQT